MTNTIVKIKNEFANHFVCPVCRRAIFNVDKRTGFPTTGFHLCVPYKYPPKKITQRDVEQIKLQREIEEFIFNHVESHNE